MIARTALAGLLLALSIPLHAEETMWLNVGGVSHHFGAGDRQYNERNFGLGLHATLEGSSWEPVAGFYRNSLDRTSLYGGAVWRGLGPCGVMLGVVTGYNVKPLAPMVAPTCRIPLGKSFAVDLLGIPPVPGQTPAVLAATFRWRFK